MMQVNLNESLSLTAAAAATQLGVTLTYGDSWVWSYSNGTVPGLTIGRVSVTGTPTAAGSYTLLLAEDDGMGNEVTAYEFPLVVVDPNAEPEPEPEPVDQSAAAVARFVGRPDDPATIALAAQHVPVITALARAYTRDRGFADGGPNADIKAVLTAATARLMANPDQIRQTVGGVSLDGFTGWTLAELAVLNRYRKRAQ